MSLCQSQELDGKPGQAVFRATHREPEAIIYWHLDEQFLGTTTRQHQLAIAPSHGVHRLTLTDQHGETHSISFEVISP